MLKFHRLINVYLEFIIYHIKCLLSVIGLLMYVILYHESVCASCVADPMLVSAEAVFAHLGTFIFGGVG